MDKGLFVVVSFLSLSRSQEGRVIRVSFSNLFKEFKSTATWLQFPFLCAAAPGSVYESTAKTTKHGTRVLNITLASLHLICTSY